MANMVNISCDIYMYMNDLNVKVGFQSCKSRLLIKIELCEESSLSCLMGLCRRGPTKWSDKVSSAFCSTELPLIGSASDINLDERPLDFPKEVIKS